MSKIRPRLLAVVAESATDGFIFALIVQHLGNGKDLSGFLSDEMMTHLPYRISRMIDEFLKRLQIGFFILSSVLQVPGMPTGGFGVFRMRQNNSV